MEKKKKSKNKTHVHNGYSSIVMRCDISLMAFEGTRTHTRLVCADRFKLRIHESFSKTREEETTKVETHKRLDYTDKKYCESVTIH